MLLNRLIATSFFYLLASPSHLLHRLLAFSVAALGPWSSWWMLCSQCWASFPGWCPCRLVARALALHALFQAAAHQWLWPPLNRRLHWEYLVSTAMPSPICWPNSFLLSPRDHVRCSKGHDLALILSFSNWLVKIYPFSENFPLGLPRLTTLSLLLLGAWDPSIVSEASQPWAWLQVLLHVPSVPSQPHTSSRPLLPPLRTAPSSWLRSIAFTLASIALSPPPPLDSSAISSLPFLLLFQHFLKVTISSQLLLFALRFQSFTARSHQNQGHLVLFVHLSSLDQFLAKGQRMNIVIFN